MQLNTKNNIYVYIIMEKLNHTCNKCNTTYMTKSGLSYHIKICKTAMMYTPDMKETIIIENIITFA